MTDLTLEDADPQDLADVVCGLTVIGAYSDDAGLDDDADRIVSLRKRIVLENRSLAEELLDAEIVTTGVDPNETIEGIRDILDNHE